MENSKIRTVLIDDEMRALNRMKILLQNFPEIEIIEQTQNPNYGVKFVISQEPDILFLDVEMPKKTGIEVADEINKLHLHTKIIFVTSFDHYAIKAIKNSAFDYLMKPVGLDELKQTLERFKLQQQTKLSNRELEIIRLIAKGNNSKAIGEQLFISRHTVDTHRRTILEKTNCKNAAELIMYATKTNLI